MLRESNTSSMHLSSHRLHLSRFTLFLLALAIIGAGLVLARQVNYGPGLHLDSMVYTSTARNLLVGDGFVQQVNKQPYLSWAPLYPVLLAISSNFLFDPLDVAGPLNAFIFGLTIFIAGRWLKDRIQSSILAIWCVLALAISIPLTSVMHLAMSEAPFILFTVLSLIHTDRFMSSDKRAYLIWAAVFAALACLTRYTGITLIMTVPLLLLLHRNFSIRERVKQAGIYVLIAGVPLCLWLLRNFIISGEPTGQRSSRLAINLSEILDIMLSDLSTYLLVGVPLNNIPAIFAVSAGLALIALAVATFHSLLHSYRNRIQRAYSFHVFGTFTLVFLCFIVVAALFSYVEPLHGRMLVPVYIPLLFVGILALDRFLGYEKEKKLLGTVEGLPSIGRMLRNNEKLKSTTLLTMIVIAIISIWLTLSLPANVYAIMDANAEFGPGVRIARILNSEMMHYIRETQISGAVLTNVDQGPWSMYLVTGWHRLFPDMNQWQRHEMQMFIEDAPGDVYMVWMDNTEEPNPFRNPQQTVLPEAELVVDLSDGTVLKVPKLSWDEDAYRAVVSREPAVRSNYDLHLGDGYLHYVKEPCNDEDIESPFFLHIIPADLVSLPSSRQDLGFDNLDFGFYAHGNRSGVRCMASVPLPDYSISSIKTGQWIRDDDRQIWSEELILSE